MKVYALVGPSGTGKSFNAVNVAGKKNVDCIIDDGLLIQNNKVIAGSSAKKEHTKLAAIKRAVFMEPQHAEQVKEAIKSCNPSGVLILGTSKDMVDRIAANLDLLPIEEYISINDISSPEDIEEAKRTREEEGKHVIPVPTFEVKKDFSGYFLDSVKSLIFRGRRPHVTEKTIVRPTYSYRGRYTISEKAIADIVIYNYMNIPAIKNVLGVTVNMGQDGVTIDVDLAVEYGFDMRAALQQAQGRIIKDVEYLTGLNVDEANVSARSIAM